MDIKKYIEELAKYYTDNVSYHNSIYSEELLQSIPRQLVEFYSNYSDLQLPFGRVYPIGTAIEESNAEPFKKEQWFCFGKDNYFTFWLCKLSENEDDMVFTIWDHESGLDIGEGIFDNLCDFLKYTENEYVEGIDDRCDVTVESCDPGGMKELMILKKIFMSTLSIGEIRSNIANGACIVKEDVNLFDAKNKLKKNSFEHIKIALEMRG